MSLCLARAAPGLQRLYQPYAELIGEAERPWPPAVEALDRLAAELPHPPVNAAGRRIRFVCAASGAALDYEARIRDSAEVPTRPGDWHDYFNALVWCVFPLAKAALNRAHLAASLPTQVGPGRGQVRDALTLFDECGVLVVSSEARLIADLRAHRWQQALWANRERLDRKARVLVIGHGTLDALRAPFAGLCAKVLYRRVDPRWFDQGSAAAVAEADRWLAEWLAARGAALSPADLAPLPLLGLPGVVPDSEDPGYYLDEHQFRPRTGPPAGLCCI